MDTWGYDYWDFINKHPGCSPDEAAYYATSKENAILRIRNSAYQGSQEMFKPDRYIRPGTKLVWF